SVAVRPRKGAIEVTVQFSHHINLTGSALRRWFVGQFYDSVVVGALWWLGLEYLHLPWAPFWAVLAALLQFIPQFGTALAVMGPIIVALFAGGLEQAIYMLMLYGGIVVIDGLLLQPIIMRRAARVPIWASLIVPILLSLVFGFWGLLLAAPLLAVIFAYRAHGKRDDAMVPHQTPPGQTITGGRLISPGTAPQHVAPQE